MAAALTERRGARRTPQRAACAGSAGLVLAGYMTIRFDDPRRLTAGGHAFHAITLRCGKCNMPRREWDESRGTAKCQEETVGRGLKRREVKQGVRKAD